MRDYGQILAMLSMVPDIPYKIAPVEQCETKKDRQKRWRIERRRRRKKGKL